MGKNKEDNSEIIEIGLEIGRGVGCLAVGLLGAAAAVILPNTINQLGAIIKTRGLLSELKSEYTRAGYRTDNYNDLGDLYEKWEMFGDGSMMFGLIRNGLIIAGGIGFTDRSGLITAGICALDLFLSGAIFLARKG